MIGALLPLSIAWSDRSQALTAARATRAQMRAMTTHPLSDAEVLDVNVWDNVSDDETEAEARSDDMFGPSAGEEEALYPPKKKLCFAFVVVLSFFAGHLYNKHMEHCFGAGLDL